MKRNVGSVDRVVRTAAGLALLSLIFIVEGDVRWFGLLGVVPILTAFVRWCPAYSIIGVSTDKNPS